MNASKLLLLGLSNHLMNASKLLLLGLSNCLMNASKTSSSRSLKLPLKMHPKLPCVPLKFPLKSLSKLLCSLKLLPELPQNCFFWVSQTAFKNAFRTAWNASQTSCVLPPESLFHCLLNGLLICLSNSEMSPKLSLKLLPEPPRRPLLDLALKRLSNVSWSSLKSASSLRLLFSITVFLQLQLCSMFNTTLCYHTIMISDFLLTWVKVSKNNSNNNKHRSEWALDNLHVY